MAVEFGTAKTVLILAIVVGCFAVLWPKLFYPMLQASVNTRAPMDSSQACCDVIFETDINAIKIMMEMCGTILHRYDDFDPKLVQAFEQGKLSKEVVNTCRTEVLNKCGVDIHTFLNDRVRLGQSYKQILDEIRSYNSSVCLKLNFGVTLGALGTPRRMRLGTLPTPRHHRQERPPHLRPDLLHPALRERGRAIPQSHIVPRMEREGRPGPIPGMRPPMGGAGHVVPAPKGSSTMGIVMPIYTIGIVVFFMYTIMKVMFKKAGDTTNSYAEFSSDPEFHKVVFAEEYIDDRASSFEDNLRQKAKRETSPSWRANEDSGTKLVVTAISGLLAEVDLQREILAKRAEEQNGSVSEIKSEDITRERIGLNQVIQQDSLPNIPQQNEEKAVMPSDALEKPYEEQNKQLIQETLAKEDDSSKEQQQSTFVPESQSLDQDSKVESNQIVEPLKLNEHQVETPNLIQELQFKEHAQPIEIENGQEQDGGAKVKVMGMEMTASCEGGQRWSRPTTPILSMSSHSRSVTPVPPPTPEPQSIFLEGALPSQSQLLVSDSETQALPLDPGELGSDTDPPVILSGKMTLSLISLDAALAAEDEQLQKQLKQEHAETQPDVANAEKVETVRAIRVNVDDEAEEEEEEDDEEEEVEEEEEEDDEQEEAGEEEEKTDEKKLDVQLVNDTQHSTEESQTATNYTTASAAAEATSATGPEETAADFSALESIGPDDEQQEDEQLGDDEEVWNGDVNSGEEEEESEEEEEDEVQQQDAPQQQQ